MTASVWVELWLGVGSGDSQSDLSSSDDLAVVRGAAGSGRGRVRRRCGEGEAVVGAADWAAMKALSVCCMVAMASLVVDCCCCRVVLSACNF